MNTWFSYCAILSKSSPPLLLAALNLCDLFRSTFLVSQRLGTPGKVWYQINKRDLPWRNTTNAYFIWLSEVILQQTRVEQGIPYYLKFINSFPTIDHLARAKEDRVLKLWQGLGYYSRARNLHYTAKDIVKKYNGKFPKDHKKLLELKGVGNYTAAAIASFALSLFPYESFSSNSHLSQRQRRKYLHQCIYLD